MNTSNQMTPPKLERLVAGMLVFVCGNLCAEPAAITNNSTQKPSPNEGDRGSIAYWQKELQGKTKSDVKTSLGTPQRIAEQGGVYFYDDEFFHPDLDQWRDLVIRFNSNNEVESFTGEGSDTKTYKLTTPTWEEAAEAAGIPTPSPSPTPSPTPNIETLKQEVQASVTTIEMTEPAPGASDSGSGGTGFLVDYKGKTFLATNIHVLEGEASVEIQLAWHHGPRPGEVNSPRVSNEARVKNSFERFQAAVTRLPYPTIKTSSGQQVKPASDLLLSQARDIALLPVTLPGDTLTISSTQPKREQRVIIIGNPEAGHTLAALEAEVTNVGPDRFELDRIRGGQIVPGMSGSPVVDVESGRVLGIIAYLTERKEWIGDEAVPSAWGTRIVPMFEVQKRFFAYRLDNLSDLQPFTWAQFINDCLLLAAIRERTLNVFWASNAYGAASDSTVIRELTPDFDNKVQLLYSSFVKDAQRFIKSADRDLRIRRWQSYQRSLETLLQNDLTEPKYQIVTPYIRRVVETTAAAARREAAMALRTEAGKIQ